MDLHIQERQLIEEFEVDQIRTLWEELRDKRESTPKQDRFLLVEAEQELFDELIRVQAVIGKTVHLCDCGDVYLENENCRSCHKWLPDALCNDPFADIELDTSLPELPFYDEDETPPVPDQWIGTTKNQKVVDLAAYKFNKQMHRK